MFYAVFLSTERHGIQRNVVAIDVWWSSKLFSLLHGSSFNFFLLRVRVADKENFFLLLCFEHCVVFLVFCFVLFEICLLIAKEPRAPSKLF